MTIASYSDLQTAIPLWLAKASDANITGNIADLIRLAETDIRTDLDIYAMETKTTAISISSEFQSLSGIDRQLTTIRRIYLTKSSPYIPLVYRTPQQLLTDWPVTTQGTPSIYTVAEGELQFRRIPDTVYSALITYRKWFDPLATTATNTLLTNWPNIYLFAGLRQAAIFLEDNELAATYAGEYQKVVLAIRNAARKVEFPMDILTMKTDTGNP